MAIWQCDFNVLPESVFIRRRGGIPHRLSAKQFNRIDLSVHTWLPDNHADRLSKLLPEIASWSSRLRWWGNEMGDRIGLFYNQGKPVDLEIRLHVGRINTILLHDFLDLLREWRCVMWSAETGEILRPTRPAVLGYLVRSSALAITWQWMGNNSDEGLRAVSQPIFICHSSKDKAFVRKLAEDLRSFGVGVWLDEWELLPGDSLNDKIQNGLSTSSWLLVILSKNSVKSQWVKRELNAGFAEELRRRDTFIIPIRVDRCKIPIFLQDKVYADFRTSYDEGINTLLRRFDITA